MKGRVLLTISLVLVLLLALLPARTANAATLTVNTTSDTSDGSCSDGSCSLRDAIVIANTNPGADTIQFAIPGGSCPGGVCIIAPTSELPWLTGGGTTIDGYTQTGAILAVGATPATIVIRIDGFGVANCSGLTITSAGNHVRGLSIVYFDWNGISIGTASATHNIIEGNYLGVRPDGTIAAANGFDGVFIGYGAQYNTIGGDESAERNLLSGNGLSGAEIHGADSDHNKISANYIGVSQGGLTSIPNAVDGVRIYGGAALNTVGGDATTERNIISGNGRSGVRIVGVGTEQNTVMGNYIGSDRTGLAALGNTTEGVYLGNQAQRNQIGGDTFYEANEISGNLDLGVLITGTNTISNTVSGNFIGIKWDNSGALGNVGSGVYITGASHNVIGGDAQGETNIISGNYTGVMLYGPNTTENSVIGNHIGTDVSGSGAYPNFYAGVHIANGASSNQIGSGTDGGNNLISGNGSYGVYIQGASSLGNRLYGNYIGVTANGQAALGNGGPGVKIEGAQGNYIGGALPDERNLISGNDGYGIEIQTGSGNVIYGNVIGLDDDSDTALPNDGTGIYLSNGATNNMIGGETDYTPANTICANNGDGIRLTGAATTGNTIAGNLIGHSYIGNLGVGVAIANGAHDNTVGGSNELGNVIASNHQYGLVISDAVTHDNIISYNSIDNSNLGGVLISAGQDNQVGPGNYISENGADGIWIVGSEAIRNLVTQNSISENVNSGIDLESGANGGILPPVISSDTNAVVTGTACAGCTVELFASGDSDDEGWVFLGSVPASGSGSFSLILTGLPVSWPTGEIFSNLTATASATASGTSEFSAVYTSDLRFLYLPAVIR